MVLNKFGQMFGPGVIPETELLDPYSDKGATPVFSFFLFQFQVYPVVLIDLIFPWNNSEK